MAQKKKKKKTAKVSTDILDGISGKSAAKHAEKFRAALEQEQSKSSVSFYSSFPLSLRGPFKTPFLGPHYHQAKPESLLALDTELVRAPFSYGLEDIDWGSRGANLEQLGSSPDMALPEDYLSWAGWVDEMLPLFKDKWVQNGIYYAILLSKN
ncbi:unnamed protein product [Prunus armeniaca]